MALYRIQWEDGSWVEAESMQEAVSTWQAWYWREFSEPNEEPDGVERVFDGEVLRAGQEEGRRESEERMAMLEAENARLSRGLELAQESLRLLRRPAVGGIPMAGADRFEGQPVVRDYGWDWRSNGGMDESAPFNIPAIGDTYWLSWHFADGRVDVSVRRVDDRSIAVAVKAEATHHETRQEPERGEGRPRRGERYGLHRKVMVVPVDAWGEEDATERRSFAVFLSADGKLRFTLARQPLGAMPGAPKEESFDPSLWYRELDRRLRLSHETHPPTEGRS